MSQLWARHPHAELAPILFGLSLAIHASWRAVAQLLGLEELPFNGQAFILAPKANLTVTTPVFFIATAIIGTVLWLIIMAAGFIEKNIVQPNTRDTPPKKGSAPPPPNLILATYFLLVGLLMPIQYVWLHIANTHLTTPNQILLATVPMIAYSYWLLTSLAEPYTGTTKNHPRIGAIVLAVVLTLSSFFSPTPLVDPTPPSTEINP